MLNVVPVELTQIKYEDGVAEAKVLVELTKNNLWRIAEISYRLEPKYGAKTIKNFAESIGLAERTIREYRRVFETYKNEYQNGSRLPFWPAQELLAVPDAAKIIAAYPAITKREARAVAKDPKLQEKITSQPEKTDEEIKKLIADAVENARLAEQKLTNQKINEALEKAKAEAGTSSNEELLQTTRLLEAAKKERQEIAEHAAELWQNNVDLLDDNKRLRHGKDIPSFRRQIGLLSNQISEFIQNDPLANILLELEEAKENLLPEDLEKLDQFIDELVRLSERAKKWATRVTPTNDQWAYHKQQVKGE
jgi:ribosomal protein L22